MKHILPILTITTLAAAASAQTASSGLSYNRVGLGYNTDSKGYSLTAEAVLGSSNFVVQAGTTIGGDSTGNGADSVSLGYLFKNVYAGVDALASIGSNEAYKLGLRKDLGIYNLEAAASFGRSKDASNKNQNVWSIELAYNVSKQLQLAVGYTDAQNTKGTTDLSARYNF